MAPRSSTHTLTQEGSCGGILYSLYGHAHSALLLQATSRSEGSTYDVGDLMCDLAQGEFPDRAGGTDQMSGRVATVALSPDMG